MPIVILYRLRHRIFHGSPALFFFHRIYAISVATSFYRTPSIYKEVTKKKKARRKTRNKRNATKCITSRRAALKKKKRTDKKNMYLSK